MLANDSVRICQTQFLALHAPSWRLVVDSAILRDSGQHREGNMSQRNSSRQVGFVKQNCPVLVGPALFCRAVFVGTI
jgi:hypothetical protein